MSVLKWRSDIIRKIENVEPERVPSLISRCPKCKALKLSFDVKTYKVRCDSCGFEVSLRV